MSRAIATGFRLDDQVIGPAVFAAGDGRMAAGNTPAHSAVITPDAMTDHGALHGLTLRLASGLLAMKLRRGQRIAVSMPPSAQRLALCAAIWAVGGVVVALDPALPQGRLTMAMQGSGARLLIEDGQGRLGPTSARRLDCRDLLAQGHSVDPDALAARGARLAPEHPALLLYGDGQQDSARGVVLSHRALLTAARGLIQRYGIGAGSRLMAPLRLNHAARLTAELAVLISGASLCDQPVFSVPVTHLILADGPLPELAQGLAPDLQPQMIALSGEARLIRDWGRALPHSRVYNSYARAELGGIAICSDPRDPAHTAQTTMGRPLRGVEVMIVDPRTSMDMLLYEIGEIWIRGATRMLRYHDDLRASAKALDQSGFFKTGDLGYLDSEGRVILCRDAFAQI